MKILSRVTLIILGSQPLHAATVVNQYDFTVNGAVPDNNPIGRSDTREIASEVTSITKVSVQVTLTGGWAGDMYAYLAKGTGFAVLLNRPGKSLAEVAGSGVSDFSVTFRDDAAFDIHTAIPSSGSVSGFFQPDAREADPDDVLDSSPRTAFLSSFQGLDANGDWTLFVTDVSGGDVMTLESWSLTIEGVPEPGTATLVALAAVGLFRRRRVVE